MGYPSDIERRRKNREFVAEYRATHSCVDCPENDPACLDFDHDDPSKKSVDISKAIKSYSLEKLKEEIAKCTVRCANCHRKRHAKERNS